MREKNRAGGDSPVHQQLLDTTGNCLSTALEMKFKSGAYVTAFWQGDKLQGVRGPQMDALKAGRCLLHRVPLHRAHSGDFRNGWFSNVLKKRSPAAIHSFQIAGTESIPRAAPVTSPGFHQRWSWLIPTGFLLFAATSFSSRPGFNPPCAPAGFTAGFRTQPFLRAGGTRTMGGAMSHTSCTASFLLQDIISQR